MSPHSLVQEYLNLTEHLYAIITNGTHLRILRDSSRLIKLSFLEFNLQQMMEEEHFADFALMFRLIHASRMPQKQEEAPESILEKYHQISLDAGSRIRLGLSNAVKQAIEQFGQGFLSHPKNQHLRDLLQTNQLSPEQYFHQLLTLIYKLLFLLVIEERNLIFPKTTPDHIRDIYNQYYSLQKLRKLAENQQNLFAQNQYHDLWIALTQTFTLFSNPNKGKHLHINPLAGDLFSQANPTIFEKNTQLDNQTLLNCIFKLSIFKQPQTNLKIRINYAALNVEEFGSVYEGLLDFNADIDLPNQTFSLKQSSERSKSGSHYTPDELVKPLIQHSLDHIIARKRKAPTTEAQQQNLLSIRVCDPACGSGHILLAAARRIAFALAQVRTNTDQPSPTDFRLALRDTIQNCIFGVDKNPLAVELCKVALWLEAHNPGKPLNFLDHHIKCGDSIVGLTHAHELQNGIPNEAFKKIQGDDKQTLKTLRDQNKKQRKTRSQLTLNFNQGIGKSLTNIRTLIQSLNQMPEETPAQIQAKKQQYHKLTSGAKWLKLQTLANLQTAPFFQPKTPKNQPYIITDQEYQNLYTGKTSFQGNQKAAHADALAQQNKFFHWFLEFPQIFANGGFDCVIGNPPFLNGLRISTHYGSHYLKYIHNSYYPAKGTTDLVAYFFRKAFQIIKSKGFQALISTNTIAQGGTRIGGLEFILNNQGQINFAIRSMKWPGLAAVEVALLTIHKGLWKLSSYLDSQKVPQITSFLDSSKPLPKPQPLQENQDLSFQGVILRGEGFVLSHEEAASLENKNPQNKGIIFPYLNGKDLSTHPEQEPSRKVINFFSWEEESAKRYSEAYAILEKKVKPYRQQWRKDKNKDEIIGVYALPKPLYQKWWLYESSRPNLYQTINGLSKILITANVSKTHAFSFVRTNMIHANTLVIIASDKNVDLAILQSSLHEHWAWKYCSTMRGDRRYSPTTAFQTFPFPQTLTPEQTQTLNTLGEQYHSHRKQLMKNTWLGLTKTYNQFHNPNLPTDSQEIQHLQTLPHPQIKKQYGKLTLELIKHLQKEPKAILTLTQTIQGIQTLRSLHIKMDQEVLKAYGWHNQITLNHDFHQIEYLPENDRTRFTISNNARKQILEKLLLLNHQIHQKQLEQTKSQTPPTKKQSPKPKSQKKPPKNPNQKSLF